MASQTKKTTASKPNKKTTAGSQSHTNNQGGMAGHSGASGGHASGSHGGQGSSNGQGGMPYSNPYKKKPPSSGGGGGGGGGGSSSGGGSSGGGGGGGGSGGGGGGGGAGRPSASSRVYGLAAANTKVDAGNGAKITNKAYVAPKYTPLKQATLTAPVVNAHAPAGTTAISDTADMTVYRPKAVAPAATKMADPVGGFAPNSASRSSLQLGALPNSAGSPTLKQTPLPVLGTAPTSSVGGYSTAMTPSMSAQPRQAFAPSKGVGTPFNSLGGGMAKFPAGGIGNVAPGLMKSRVSSTGLGPVRSYKAGRGFGLGGG